MTKRTPFVVIAFLATVSACTMTAPEPRYVDREDRRATTQTNGFVPACTHGGRRCHGGGKPDPAQGHETGDRRQERSHDGL